MYTTRSASEFKGTHSGRAAWIVAAGPSAAELDLNHLRGRIIIPVNGATRLLGRFHLEADYFATTDERFLGSPESRPWGTSQLSSKTIRVIRDKCQPIDDHLLLHRTLYVHTIGRSGFSKNLHLGHYFGCTSVMLAIQFAFWAGCSPIVLIGVDLSTIFEPRRFYEEREPQPIDPVVDTQLWNIANANQELIGEGCELISCSPRSLLRPYVPYKPFRQLIDSLPS